MARTVSHTPDQDGEEELARRACLKWSRKSRPKVAVKSGGMLFVLGATIWMEDTETIALAGKRVVPILLNDQHPSRTIVIQPFIHSLMSVRYSRPNALLQE